jgi:hypothetical protein
VTGFEREHRTSRSYALRFRSTIPWTGRLAIDVTSLPARWITDDPEDLRIVARHAAEAADWLEARQGEAQSAT